MKDTIVIDMLRKDGDGILEELSRGNMVAARSKNSFIYFVEDDGEYRLFYHIPGAQSAGRKSLPKNEKHNAVIRSFARMSDTLFLVEYDRGMNLAGVLASAEEGILIMFPGDDRAEDGMIEFFVPQTTKKGMGGRPDA